MVLAKAYTICGTNAAFRAINSLLKAELMKIIATRQGRSEKSEKHDVKHGSDIVAQIRAINSEWTVIRFALTA